MLIGRRRLILAPISLIGSSSAYALIAATQPRPAARRSRIGNGVYIGTDRRQLASYEKLLGAEVSSLAVHTGRVDWADWTESIVWALGQYSGLSRELTWSIPMFANSGSLAAAAAGEYNAYYASAAKVVSMTPNRSGRVIVRIGEEFNGDWMPWAAKGRERDFIVAYRQFVNAFRATSSKFVFVWNVNIGDVGMDPAIAYPGDDVVDIISMDFYYNTKWDPQDPEAAWSFMVRRPYGLQWLETFASDRRKPTAYSEWGVCANDHAASYVAHVCEWFAAHDVVYANYWNSGDSTLHQGSDTALAMRRTFGGGLLGAVRPSVRSSPIV